MVAVGHVVDAVLEVLDRPPDLARAHPGESPRAWWRTASSRSCRRPGMRPDVELVGRDLQRARHHEQVAGEAQRVGVDRSSSPVAWSKSATAPTVSSGWPPERCQRSRSVTTTSASAKSRVDVAEVERALVGAVGAQVVVHERRAVLERRSGSTQHGQRLVLDVDQRERVLGEVAAVGDDHRDALADVAHLVDGEAAPACAWPGRGRSRAAGRSSSAACAPVITACTPGAAHGRGGVDRDDPRVGVRAAQHGGVQHARRRVMSPM